MPEPLLDAEAAEKKDLKRIEESLHILWEKARNVSDALLRLKSENKELQSRVMSLEGQERRWNEELQRREHELVEVRKQLLQAQTNGSSVFSKEELETLKAKLKELIGKINSRL